MVNQAAHWKDSTQDFGFNREVDYAIPLCLVSGFQTPRRKADEEDQTTLSAQLKYRETSTSSSDGGKALQMQVPEQIFKGQHWTCCLNAFLCRHFFFLLRST